MKIILNKNLFMLMYRGPTTLSNRKKTRLFQVGFLGQYYQTAWL